MCIRDRSDTGYLDASYRSKIPTFVALDPIEWTAAKLGSGKTTGCFPADAFEQL